MVGNDGFPIAVVFAGPCNYRPRLQFPSLLVINRQMGCATVGGLVDYDGVTLSMLLEWGRTWTKRNRS